jgi:exopolysaccharide biosynthesis polyprenyl glycosylphosphotransferase
MATTLVLLEVTSIFSAVCAAIELWVRPLVANSADMAGLLAPAATLSVCCAVAFYYNDLYDFRTVRRFQEFASRLPRCVMIVMILSVPLYGVVLQDKMTLGAFTSSLLLTIGVVLLLRAVWYAVIQCPTLSERVLILGATPLSRLLRQAFDSQPLCTVVDIVDDPAQLNKKIEEARPDRIIVAVTERRGQLPVQQLLEARMRGIVVEDGAEIYERLTGKLAIESHTPINLVFSKDFRKPRLHLALARGISLLVAVVGLVILAPILGLIALAIKLDSCGPVFLVQDRVGMGGKPFKLLKFRTMRPIDRETSLWFLDNSNRITRVGKWLRKFRLDELPQLLNVLRGDMNLVGPRPQRVPKFELLALVLRNAPELGKDIPYHSLRSVVRPGITGWAQIRNGYASNLEEEIEKTKYDLYYIKHMSLWFDLRIILETVKIVLSGHGSEAPVATEPGHRRLFDVWHRR